MKQIVTYWEKTKKKTQTSIAEIKAILKQQLKKDDYAEILNTIKVSETAATPILHQQKFKKFFNTLKYKPKPTVKTTNFTEGNEFLEKLPTIAIPNYAEILKATKNPSLRTSKTNPNNYKTKYKPTKNCVH